MVLKRQNKEGQHWAGERHERDEGKDKEQVAVEGMSQPARRAPWRGGDPEDLTVRCQVPAEEGCPRDGMAEPRSLLSTVKPKRQRTSTSSRLRDGPDAVVASTPTVESCRTVP